MKLLTVPYANSSRTLARTARIDARGKTIRQFKDEIMNVISSGSFPWGAIGYIEIVGNVDAICPNLNDDNFVIDAKNATPSIVEVKNPVAFSVTNHRGILIFYSCSGETYRAHIMDGVFYYEGVYVYTKNRKNVADTWKLSSGNELVIDANNTSTDQIVIGNIADNYTGSGFKYIFKNGKGNNADVYVNNVYGRANLILTERNNTDINNPKAITNDTASIEYTGTLSDNPQLSYHTVYTTRGGGNTYQFAIPLFTDRQRVKIRGHAGNNLNPITTTFREIPYADEVVTLTGTNIVTGTLNVPTQPATDNSDKVASTAFVQAAIAAALKAKGL